MVEDAPCLATCSPKVLSVVLARVMLNPARITLTDAWPLAEHVLPQDPLLQLPAFLNQLVHSTRLRRPLVDLHNDHGERLPQYGTFIEESAKATLAVDRQSVEGCAKRFNCVCRDNDTRSRVIGVYSHVPIAVNVTFCVVGCDDLEAASPNRSANHLVEGWLGRVTGSCDLTARQRQATG